MCLCVSLCVRACVSVCLRVCVSCVRVVCVCVCVSVSPCVCASGEVPFNHEILREANALCHRLPVLNTFKFKTDFYDVSVSVSESQNSASLQNKSFDS